MESQKQPLTSQRTKECRFFFQIRPMRQATQVLHPKLAAQSRNQLLENELTVHPAQRHRPRPQTIHQIEAVDSTGRAPADVMDPTARPGLLISCDVHKLKEINWDTIAASIQVATQGRLARAADAEGCRTQNKKKTNNSCKVTIRLLQSFPIELFWQLLVK